MMTHRLLVFFCINVSMKKREKNKCTPIQIYMRVFYSLYWYYGLSGFEVFSFIHSFIHLDFESVEMQEKLKKQ